MKLIFADIDGPLATDECGKREDTKWGSIYRMNPKCVDVLNDILKETDAELVISSDWRLYWSLEEMGEIFEWNGIIKKPVGMISNKNVSMFDLEINRIHQIRIYLDEHKPEKWVAFDDLNLKSKKVPNFVLCDSIDGLCGENVKESILKFIK